MAILVYKSCPKCSGAQELCHDEANTGGWYLRCVACGRVKYISKKEAEKVKENWKRRNRLK